MSAVHAFALKCPNCGANLTVPRTYDVFACSYCGATIKLAQAGGTVALELIAGHLEGVRRGTDKTAAELMIRRLREDAAVLDGELTDMGTRRTKYENYYTDARAKLEVQKKSFAGLLGFFVVIALVMTALFNKLEIPYAEYVAIAIVGIIAVFVWRTVNLGMRRQLVALEKKRIAALGEVAAKETEIRAAIHSKKTKLADAMRIAES